MFASLLSSIASEMDSLPSSNRGENLRAALNGLHRTRQEMLGSLVIFPLLVQWAEDYKAGNYDLRNQWVCKTAHTLLEGIPNDLREDLRVSHTRNLFT